MHTFVLAVLAVVALAPSLARADALAPPPTDCPPGAVGVSSRRGEHCEWTPCETASACPSAGEAGRFACSRDSVAVCVRTIEYLAADVQQGPRVVSLPAETWRVAVGPCDARGGCGDGQRCERRQACVSEGSEVVPASTCACGAPGTRASFAAPSWLVVLALGVARRRR